MDRRRAAGALRTAAQDVEVVVNTSGHFDHIGNNTRFTNATFFLQRDEFPLVVHPPPWALYYYREFAHNLLDVRDRLELIEGDLRICPGVTLHKLAGHSPGTQVVLLESRRGESLYPRRSRPLLSKHRAQLAHGRVL